jgi:hypothetical protein
VRCSYASLTHLPHIIHDAESCAYLVENSGFKQSCKW